MFSVNTYIIHHNHYDNIHHYIGLDREGPYF